MANDLDEYSNTWELESTYPIARGVSSAIVSLIGFTLWSKTLYKVCKKRKEDPDRSPIICKHCLICSTMECCGGYDDFECCRFFVMPSPIDLCLCVFSLGTITFACKAFGDIYYGDWITAQQELLGSIVLGVFAFFGGLITLAIYVYFYSILDTTVQSAGAEYHIPKYIKILHKYWMIVTLFAFPTGNILMEVFGTAFGSIFRVGMYISYGCGAIVLFGMFHLTLLLVQRLQRVLVTSTLQNVQSIDQCAAKLNHKSNLSLLHFITKMLVIVTLLITITALTAAFTLIRSIYPSPAISLARWFWFSLINSGGGAFCLYLTIGLNYPLYRFWCRCDKMVHQCITFCFKISAVRRYNVTHRNTITTGSTQSANASHSVITPQSTAVSSVLSSSSIINNTPVINRGVTSFSAQTTPNKNNNMNMVYIEEERGDDGDVDIVYDLEVKTVQHVQLQQLNSRSTENEQINRNHKSNHSETAESNGIGFNPGITDRMISTEL